MRIVFFATNIVPVHARTLEERALGGTETGLIRLAEALDRLGHEVIVYTPFENPPTSKPIYLNSKQLEKGVTCDVFVSLRDWIPMFYGVNAPIKCVWTGDSWDHFLTFGMGDKRVSKAIDALLTVSDWHSDTLAMHSGFPRDKCYNLGNGIHPEFFEGTEVRGRKRLIYSSTPYRGLRHTPNYFRILREKHRDAEFHVFSSYKVYDQPSDLQFVQVTNELRQIPGVTLHESVKQNQLAREFMKSSVLFYPNEFEETSCITAMEAMAAGCVPLTSALAALPETIKDAGVLIPGKPGTAEYDQKFIQAADRLLSDDAYWTELHQRGLSTLKTNTWEARGRRFCEIVGNLAQKKGESKLSTHLEMC